MSKTPIREGLALLESEGLVRVLPRKGYVVVSLSPQDIREIAQIRRVLEMEAVRNAARLASAEEIQALSNLLESGPLPLNSEDFVGANAAFHRCIALASGNARLADLVGKLTEGMVFVLGQTKHDQQVAAAIHADHSDIVEALRAGNAEKGAEIMAAHIDRSVRLHLDPGR